MPDVFKVLQLPAGFKIPGFYFGYDFSDAGSAAPNNRLLIWGYMGAAGTAAPNRPLAALTQDVVNVACQPWSMAAHAYAAAKSQLPLGLGAEIYVLPLIEPSGGTKAVHKVKFMAAPVAGVLGLGTTAAASGVCTVTFAGRGASFNIDQGDTFADIATAAKAALDLVPDLPVTITITGGDTLEAADRHKGAHGNDMPVVVTFSDAAMQVAASPGTITFASGPAGAGTATVRLNLHTVPVAIAASSTDPASGGAVRDAVNAGGYCCSAAQAGTPTGEVTLFYRNGRPAHRLSASAAGISPQTLTAAFGTLGAGNPAIGPALAALTADAQAYKAWAYGFLDTASWSSLAAHVIGQGMSPVEKGQVVHGCETYSLADIATADLAAATSPSLYSSPRFNLDHSPGAQVRGFEIAARTAALVAAEEYQARNFNGRALVGSDDAPLGIPDRADRPQLDEVNTAITTYRRTPISVDAANQNAIVRSTTTYKAAGSVLAKLEKWSCILTLDYYRTDLKSYLATLYREKSIKAHGTPRTQNAISPKGVKAAIYQKMLEWDDQDLFDGAEQLRDAIQTGVLVSPTRIDVALPMRPPADLDQLAILGSLVP